MNADTETLYTHCDFQWGVGLIHYPGKSLPAQDHTSYNAGPSHDDNPVKEVKVVAPRRKFLPKHTLIVCPGCSRTTRHEGLGLCERCYNAERRARKKT